MKKEIAFINKVPPKYPIKIADICVNGSIPMAQAICQSDIIRNWNFFELVRNFNQNNNMTINEMGIFEFRGPYNPGGFCNNILLFSTGTSLKKIINMDNQGGSCKFDLDESQISHNVINFTTTFRTKEDAVIWYNYMNNDPDIYENVSFYASIYKWL